MNKKATDKIISVYWFTILFIVAGAIVYMVILNYGEPYDVRKIEANIMVNKVADCLTVKGYFNKDVLSEDFQNDFLNKCNLNFHVEDYDKWKEQEQYYLGVEISNFQTKESSFQAKGFPIQIKNGNINLVEDCKRKGKLFPVCVEKEFYVSGKDKESNGENIPQYKIKILSIVRKTEKNVN